MKTESELSLFFSSAERFQKLDAAQDAFVCLWEKHHRVEMPALRRRTRQREIDEHRRWSARRENLVTEVIQKGTSIYEDVERREMCAALRRAVERLPRRYREICEDLLLERSPGEIAVKMQCPKASVYTLIRRAFELLRNDPVVVRLEC